MSVSDSEVLQWFLLILACVVESRHTTHCQYFVYLLSGIGSIDSGVINGSGVAARCSFSAAIVGWHGEMAIDLDDCTVLFLWVVNSKDSCFSILVINISGTPTIFDMS